MNIVVAAQSIELQQRIEEATFDIARLQRALGHVEKLQPPRVPAEEMLFRLRVRLPQDQDERTMIRLSMIDEVLRRAGKPCPKPPQVLDRDIAFERRARNL